MKKTDTNHSNHNRIDDTLLALRHLRDELVILSLAMKDAEFENDAAGRQQAMLQTTQWLNKISAR